MEEMEGEQMERGTWMVEEEYRREINTGSDERQTEGREKRSERRRKRGEGRVRYEGRYGPSLLLPHPACFAIIM